MEDYKKKYEDALKKAKENKPIEEIFPELTESEDEKIRKAIRYAIGQSTHSNGILINGVSSKEALTWLEKQGEQFSAWSEEDDWIKIDLISHFKEIIENIKSEEIVSPSVKILVGKMQKWIAWLEKQGELQNKLINYRNYLIYQTEHWSKKEHDKTNSKIGTQDCIGHANAFISAREEFEEMFDYDSWSEEQGDQKRIPRFKVGDFVKDTNYKDEPIYEVVYIDSQCYICEYRGKENMGDRAVMHFAFENPNLHLVQKSTDKVKPKFKVGDWVVQGYNILKIKCVGDTYYCYETVGGYVDDMLISEIDSLYHLWSIQDAKDGDVLYMDNGLSTCTFIYETINNRIIQKYASYNKFGFEGRHYLILNDGYVCPATKEQCDLLFQKMKEAGYEWDTEKKELKKIEQKPAWSEEDEKIINALITVCLLPHDEMDGRPWHKWADWLKCLLQRSGLQPKQEWSKEDERMCQDTIQFIETGWTNNGKSHLIPWLKSLKPNHWKPSDEQMKTLEHYMHTLTCNEHKEVLFGLMEQLKKLKG